MAVRTISTKLAVEGEAEYKKSIAACNGELSTLKSSLGLVEAAFKGNANSMEALKEKGAALEAIYKKQTEKIATLEDALKNAQNAQAKYSDRVTEAEANVSKYEKALADLKESTGDTSEEQEALTAELEKWKTELSNAQAGQEAAARGVQGWQRQLNNANAELYNLDDEIQKNKKYLAEAEKSTDGCAKSIDKYGNEVKDTSGAIDQLAGVLAAAGVAKGIKEIAESLYECSQAAAEFETSIAKVATIADTSTISLDQIRAQIIKLSGDMGVSASAIAEATYSAISAGVDTASSVEFVEKATRLAAGGFTEAETAVDVLTTAINAYGLSVKDTEKISDILITTQNKGKTTVDALAQSVGKVIPLAAAYGVEMDNLGAAYAVLTANGVATAEAGTYEDYSPAAVLGEIARSPELKFSVTISEWTLYKYIDMGLFLTLTNKNLPVKGRRKKKNHKIKKTARAPKGKSIERRPAEVDTRETFGHWEMDSVIGKKSTKPRLLVLTERRTRQEIVIRVPDGTTESVVRALDHLERKYGELFPVIFKSITVDNGSEFADCEGIERSIHGGKRTTVYYCHPYTSSERGSNEKQNQMLRRRFPKGTDFCKVKPAEVEAAADWLNQYPREIFGYASSDELFREELSRLA